MHTDTGRSLAEAHFKPPNYVDLFAPWEAWQWPRHTLPVWSCTTWWQGWWRRSKEGCSRQPRRLLHSNQQARTSPGKYTMSKKVNIWTNVKEQERPPDRNSVWEMARLQPERYWCSSGNENGCSLMILMIQNLIFKTWYGVISILLLIKKASLTQ